MIYFANFCNYFQTGYSRTDFGDKNRNTPKKVEPQSFFGKTFPCQEHAASIRNRVVGAIERNDIQSVASNYVTNRKLLKNQYISAGISWLFNFASLTVVPYTIPLLFISLPYSVVTMRNVTRCKETEGIAMGYLEKKLTDRQIQALNQLQWSGCGLLRPQVARVLQNDGGDLKL